MVTETENKYFRNQEAVRPIIQPVRYNRLLESPVAVTWETVLVGVLTLMAGFSRFWTLSTRVMSHDESLHVYYSWLLDTGKGFYYNPA